MSSTETTEDALRAQLDMASLPRHVAIIMDGNGRWAKRHGLSRAAGHEAGARSVRAVVEACRELEHIKVLSLYAFSTENWRRSKNEVNVLFRLLSKYIREELDNIHKEEIRFTVMGRRVGLSAKTLRELQQAEERTRDNRAMCLNIAINYGGRAELADAAKAIAHDCRAGKLDPGAIDEACLARYLYRPAHGDVDLLIRTSGEMRVSNFMLWQISYAEIVVTDTLWPDFRKPHVHEAILEYQSRNRRFGAR